MMPGVYATLIYAQTEMLRDIGAGSYKINIDWPLSGIRKAGGACRLPLDPIQTHGKVQ